MATAALVLFGVAAAWNFRRELMENLDRQIQDEAADFAAEMDEQQFQTIQGKRRWSSPATICRGSYVEVRRVRGRTLPLSRAGS